ncbi:DUF4159 domain-containing protein [Mesorhizobium koreense]|uniref:DUF4159 domain-containing protein n=1 Tax=Mesorhizobium koreense TaxID=3074855 RepID=UPI00287B67B0|nr:DUF4159 domain-containing protein [Mesorhizobium sp. WR6]
MSWLALSFGQPLVLFGLAALPVIWWLLRATPPRPQDEVFPPLRILARVLKREETPERSPWWLTLLRLLMAALIILALADPVINPREKLPTKASALAMVMDNGWASAPDWDKRVATAARLIADAGDRNEPVMLAFTAEKPNAEIGPFDAKTAEDRLRAAKPRPIPVDRASVYGRVAAAIHQFPGARLAILSDGLATKGDEAAFKAILGENESGLVWAAPDRLTTLGLTAADNQPDAFAVTAVRAENDKGPRQATIGAFDTKGRRIADATLTFAPGASKATGKVPVPFELRNDFTSIAIDGQRQAGAMRVLDDSSRRRRVGLLSQADSNDLAQPLLSPLYYISRALRPFADLIEPKDQDLAKAIPELIDQKPAMIVMADIGTLPPSARQKLIGWLKDGGTLVRFAGPRLAAVTENDEELLPVPLRLGERSLGGALSWTKPQPVAKFPSIGPFSELSAPQDVTVNRQVLAEPTPDLADHTWASLADGTPLVTGAKRGKGTLVLFHVTPEATWSNLPISGSFVEMLHRIASLSRNQGAITNGAGETAQSALPPYRMVAADGTLGPPSPDARPLERGNAAAPVTIENPPGLYGGEDGVVAHNLLDADTKLVPLERPATSLPVTEVAYALDQSRALKGSFLLAALILMILDALAVLWLGGLFSRRPRKAASASAAASLFAFAIVGGLLMAASGHAFADDTKPGDQVAIDAVSKTRIAYVITGDKEIDDISRAGLLGLSRFLIEKTALEPGDPAGVDIAKDELSFYPLIYWPIDARAAMPSEDAIARIDAYMKQGGTVLFDTRDQFTNGLDASNVSPATERLRDILSNLNVPPLEPVPPDHVLTKSFYILPEFPGRYDDGPLWVEASAEAKSSANRPVRTGDGVSPILITGNDFAGAWAIDDNGNPMFPTVPDDPMQRVYAYRAGVNIMMYMLTGNYKSDQVHVPTLLERLGQ